MSRINVGVSGYTRERSIGGPSFGSTVKQRSDWFTSPSINYAIPYIRSQRITSQIVAIKQNLTPTARDFFSYLLELPQIGMVSPTSPVVSADLDGSVGRMLLVAIQAGMVMPNQTLQENLAKILNAEAHLYWSSDGDNESEFFVKFQSNEEIQKAVSNILKNLTVLRDGACYPVIFIGDSIFDRLSCKMFEESEIRKVLHDAGAVFILGNHDSYEAAASIPYPYDYQSGAYANFKNTNKEFFERHAQEVFNRCHFDSEKKTLYIHNGIKVDESNPQVVCTAFGNIEANSMDEFVSKLRGLVIKDYRLFSLFRPLPPLNRDHWPEYLKEVRIVHGHNGVVQDSKNGVFVLNSRIHVVRNVGENVVNDQCSLPVAVQLGSTPPDFEIRWDVIFGRKIDVNC